MSKSMCPECHEFPVDNAGLCTGWGTICRDASAARIAEAHWAAAIEPALAAYVDDGLAQLAWWANNSTSEAC